VQPVTDLDFIETS